MGDQGLKTLRSGHGFAPTLRRLRERFAAQGITIFAEVDHQAAAHAAGLEMPPATVLVFGNPRAGTPIMRKNLLAAVDLPLKVLVCEPEPGKVLVSMRRAEEIGRMHGLDAEQVEHLAYAEGVVADALA